jgi:hypothetical protein
MIKDLNFDVGLPPGISISINSDLEKSMRGGDDLFEA